MYHKLLLHILHFGSKAFLNVCVEINEMKRKKSFLKEEPISDPKEAGNKSVPKSIKYSSKEKPLSSGPEKAARSKSSSSKKKKKLQKLSQEDQNGQYPGGV